MTLVWVYVCRITQVQRSCVCKILPMLPSAPYPWRIQENLFPHPFLCTLVYPIASRYTIVQFITLLWSFICSLHWPIDTFDVTHMARTIAEWNMHIEEFKLWAGSWQWKWHGKIQRHENNIGFIALMQKLLNTNHRITKE